MLLNTFINDLEERLACTVIKSADDVKGRESIQRQHCYSGWPRQSGATGLQEPHETQQGQMQHSGLGK